MKQLYFVRHGESEFNLANKFAGTSDTVLTEKGHKQAKQAGKDIQQQGMSFDIIVSSPLKRAQHTARHIASATGYPRAKIELNPLFQERHYGSLEGMNAKTVLGARHFFDESAIDDHEEVETLQDFQQRATRALEYLRSLDHETVLVVAHGAFGRALYRAINDLPITERDIRYKNAELVKFI